ncbi:zinc-dependent metalloprotease [Kordia sp.]|uniref:zinc-dependent metalloprotease n=1 Tax=Kordia sp. TaxID=1965332 RepID=UPI003D2BF41C
MKPKKHFFFGLILLFSIVVAAQSDTSISTQIDNARNQGQNFVDISNIFTLNKNYRNDKISKELNAANFLTYNEKIAENLINNRTTKHVTMRVSLPNENSTITVDLIEVSDSFYDYQVKTSTGKTSFGKTEQRHFRGIVKGQKENSIVAISIFKKQFMGVISLGNRGNINIGKLPKDDVHIVYNDGDIRNPAAINCATDSEIMSDKLKEIYKSIGDRVTTRSEGDCVRVYFETDFGLYNHFNQNTTDVEDFVTGLFNQIAAIYELEDITLVISEIFIWETDEGYSPWLSAGLEDFVLGRPTFNGDIAHMLTSEVEEPPPLDAFGIANGIGGLCSSTTNLSAHAFTRMVPNFQVFPTYSRQVKVAAHEMGHNLGSVHTHQCAWNGNNTAIDGCASNNCAENETIPANGGTIMSYCDTSGSGTVNFSLGFGDQPGDVIRAVINTADCLSECDTDGCVEILNIDTNVDSGTVDNQEAEKQIILTNTVFDDAEAIYHAGEEVLIKKDFDALKGSVFRAYIEDCTGEFVKRQNTSITNTQLIDDSYTKEKLIIHPNPSNGIFEIQIQNIVSKTYLVEVYNINGNKIFAENIDKNNAEKVDISKYEAGFYFVKVITAKSTFTKTIMKK